MLGCLIIGSTYLIFNSSGEHTLTPGKFGPFRFKGFTSFYNNAIYAFLFHHAIPGIYKPVKPAKSIPVTVSLGFITAFIILTTECLTGIVAFGTKMDIPANKTYFCNNFDNEVQWLFIATSFYILLSVASFPVYTIAARNNLMKAITPDKIP